MKEPLFALGAPLLLDHVGERRVAEFVWHKLRAHDLALLEWFKLLPLSGRHLLRGLCRYPLRVAPRSSELRQGYRITASANVVPSFYPRRYPLAVGTVTREPSARRSRRRRAFSYVVEEATFRDAAEALVFVAGHEAFHFLRHSRQIAGRNTEPSANRHGLAWLEEWRRAQGAGARGRRTTRLPRGERARDGQLLLPFA
jgi:hypothetical protein